MIRRESIEGLKARLDIVDVIGSYIELKRSGATYKARCPFHEEKTPSFVVTPSRQMYHCFGCGAGGDAIKFVMEIEKLSYPEAIEKLARQYNYTLHYDQTPQKTKPKILETISEFWRVQLEKTTHALAYLKSRGVYESMIEKFELGWAPDSAITLAFARSHFLAADELVAEGVAGRDELGRLYARFTQRLIFPIRSHTGELVGFGGRTLSNHPAKYINSPQSELFNKSRLLYGYHLAKESIFRHKEILVTEGYLDVIMLHQAGFTQAVATLGTALTKEHLPLLRRGEPRVIVAYDGDNAGVAAALKAALLLSEGGFEGGVVLFTGGKDPADMIHEGRSDEVRELLRHPRPFVRFVIEQMVASYDLNIPERREEALQELKKYLLTLSPIMQEEYRPMVARLLGIRPELLGRKGREVRMPARCGGDLGELSLIKTLLLRRHLLDHLVEFLHPDLFEHHRNLFEALWQERDDPALLALLADDAIATIDDEEVLRRHLAALMCAMEERRLARIRENESDFRRKSHGMRRLQERIRRLKAGELLPYVDTSEILKL
ncbi:MAG: DNA primase [Campylobacterales bacterium]